MEKPNSLDGDFPSTVTLLSSERTSSILIVRVSSSGVGTLGQADTSLKSMRLVVLRSTEFLQRLCLSISEASSTEHWITWIISYLKLWGAHIVHQHNLSSLEAWHVVWLTLFCCCSNSKVGPQRNIHWIAWSEPNETGSEQLAPGV